MGKIQFLIRCDDLGYSQGVNYGLEKALRFGMSRSVGVMTNMPDAAHGLDLIKGLPLCVGQHTNICTGKPICDPQSIPSLVGPDGNFKPSKEYRTAKEDFVVLEQAVLEVEAQYLRFKELVGEEPGYFEGHAVRSANFIRALEIVAERHNLKFSSMSFPGQVMRIGTAQAYRCGGNPMVPEYDPEESLKDAVRTARRDMPNLCVCHPGYVDYDLMQSSTLTLNRAKEAAMLSNPGMKAWLEENQVELISYQDVGNQ